MHESAKAIWNFDIQVERGTDRFQTGKAVVSMSSVVWPTARENILDRIHEAG